MKIYCIILINIVNPQMLSIYKMLLEILLFL